MNVKTALICLALSLLLTVFAFCGPENAAAGKRHLPSAPTADLLDKHPDLDGSSKRAQIERFVAFFADRGFHQTELSALYYPSGKIRRFRYHSNHGGTKVAAAVEPTSFKGRIGSRSHINIYVPGYTTTTHTPMTTTTTTMGETVHASLDVNN